MTLAEGSSGASVGLSARDTASDSGARLVLGFVVLLVFLRFVLAATADLAEDEAYYWLWSTHLAAGYYDHPPMIAYWIRAGTAIFGQTAFGVRFVALLSSLAGSYLLYRASLSLFRDAGAALLAVLWLNATLLCNAAAIVATPDTPLAFFATLTLFTLAKLIETGKGAWWYGVGAALGLAFMSKYTAVLLLPGVFIWMAVHGGRAALVRAAGALYRRADCGRAGCAGFLVELRARVGLVRQAGAAQRQGQAGQCAGERWRASGRAGGPCNAADLRLLRVRQLFRAASRLEAAGGALASAWRGLRAGFPVLPGPRGEPENPAELAGLHLPRRDTRRRSRLSCCVEGTPGAAMDRGELPACAMAGHSLHARGVLATGPWRASHRGERKIPRRTSRAGQSWARISRCWRKPKVRPPS